MCYLFSVNIKVYKFSGNIDYMDYVNIKVAMEVRQALKILAAKKNMEYNDLLWHLIEKSGQDGDIQKLKEKYSKQVG